MPVDLIVGAVRRLFDLFGPLEEALSAIGDELSALFAAEEAAERGRIEKARMDAEKGRLERRITETAPGRRSVTIERPLAAQVVGPDAGISLRFEGLPQSVMEHDATTPARVHVVLNGTALDLSSFKARSFSTSGAGKVVNARGGDLVATRIVGPAAMRSSGPSRPLARGGRKLAASGSGKPGGPKGPTRFGKVTRPSAAIIAPVTSMAGFTLTGDLPDELLLDGLNTLLVEVLVGRGERIQSSCGFFHQKSATSPPRVAGRAPLPTARRPTAKDLLVMPKAKRQELAAALRAGLAAKTTDPKAHLATLSPAIAKRLGIEPPPGARLATRPKLRRRTKPDA